MQKRLKVVIEDDETIVIDNARLKEASGISIIISDAFEKNSGLIVDIEPEDNAFYKGTRKAISAIVSAGVPVEQLRYKIDGNLITIDELRQRPPTWGDPD